MRQRLALLWGLVITVVLLGTGCDMSELGLLSEGDEALNTGKEISVFSFQASENPALADDVDGIISGMTISVRVPFGTDITSLTPKIIHTGTSISLTKNSPLNFTEEVICTVTAEDSTTQSYTVSVTTAPDSSKEISSFSFTAAGNAALSGDITASLSGTAISVTVPFGTNVSALVPQISHSGAGISPSSGIAQNFSSSITYVVTAPDASTQSYTVSVGFEAPLTTKDITAFTFTASANAALSEDVTGAISGNSITAMVPYSTDVSSLTPQITHTGTGISPAMDTAGDFSSSVTYTVTAEDTSTKPYTVSISRALITRDELEVMIAANEDVTVLDTSGITDMNKLFLYKSSFNQDISGWDVSNVTNMKSMFYHATSFNQDISSWNLDSITGDGITYMFFDADSFNQDISDWSDHLAEDLNHDGFSDSSASYNCPLTTANHPYDSWN